MNELKKIKKTVMILNYAPLRRMIDLLYARQIS